jgi:hypothetical protein
VAYRNDSYPDEQICGPLQNNLAPYRMGCPRNRADSLLCHREKAEDEGWGMRVVDGFIHRRRFNDGKKIGNLMLPKIRYPLPVALSLDGNHVMSGYEDGSVKILDFATGKEIAQFITFKDGEWVVITPEGHYNASPQSGRRTWKSSRSIFGVSLACLNLRKQGGHRTHLNTCLAGVAGRRFGLGAVIKADDRVDPAPGKG